MSYKGLPENLVARISPVDARAYAAASGWVRVPTVNGKLAVFALPESELDQLLVPLDVGMSDYARRMAEVVTELAQHEARPAVEVLNDLLLPPSDVLRFRLDEPDAEAGVLSLEQGLELFQGVKKAILAAACSAVQPQPFHPRLSRAEAEQLLHACRLGQTERGSFTAVVACPLNAVNPTPLRPMPLFEREAERGFEHPAASALDGHSEPFTRRATGLLMRSIAAIVAAVDGDRVESLLSPASDGVRPSANLCEALLAMQPNGDRSRLTVRATWARTLPPPPESAPPSIVHLARDHFPAIERLSVALRPAKAPMKAYFVGLVDALFGTPDEQNRVSGDVQLLILNEEGNRKARVNLDADDYHVAWEAHGQAGYVALQGILNLGDRVHRIEDVSNFKLLRE